MAVCLRAFREAIRDRSARRNVPLVELAIVEKWYVAIRDRFRARVPIPKEISYGRRCRTEGHARPDVRLVIAHPFWTYYKTYDLDWR